MEPFEELARPPGTREMMLMKIRIDMPLPMPRAVISSPIHMTTVAPAVRVKRMSANLTGVRLAAPWESEQEDVAHRLDGRQADREVPAVLGDDLLALLALFLELLELGDDHREELHDDRGRDVGHDAQGEHGDLARARRPRTG